MIRTLMMVDTLQKLNQILVIGEKMKQELEQILVLGIVQMLMYMTPQMVQDIFGFY